MTVFQKILIAIPVAIYVGIICFASWHVMSDSGAISAIILSVIFSVVGILIVLVASIIIRMVFLLKVSVTGSIIIALWLSIFAGLGYRFWPHSSRETKKESYDNYFTHKQWKAMYEGQKQTILIAAQKFAEDTILKEFDFKKYFTVVQPLTSDTSKFESYYFYADQNHPDTSSMMVVYMISDSSGHILSYRKDCTYDSVRLKDVFYKSLDEINLVTSIVDTL